jgi:D-serine/D-alanine/glycine transporter
LVLGLIYFFKTRNNPYHQKFVEQFREKVIAQNAAAKEYRARSR